MEPCSSVRYLKVVLDKELLSHGKDVTVACNEIHFHYSGQNCQYLREDWDLDICS